MRQPNGDSKKQNGKKTKEIQFHLQSISLNILVRTQTANNSIRKSLISFRNLFFAKKQRQIFRPRPVQPPAILIQSQFSLKFSTIFSVPSQPSLRIVPIVSVSLSTFLSLTVVGRHCHICKLHAIRIYRWILWHLAYCECTSIRLRQWTCVVDRRFAIAEHRKFSIGIHSLS